MRWEENVVRTLYQKNLTLSSAESCTGGLLAHTLTNVPGSSKVFKPGLVLYSNQAKHRLVKVPVSLLRAHGAVSSPVAAAMAKGVRKLISSDFGIAVTGIAGPSGGSASKPVGLTYIAVSSAKKTRCLKFLFKGSRIKIKEQAAEQALRLIYQLISV